MLLKQLGYSWVIGYNQHQVLLLLNLDFYYVNFDCVVGIILFFLSFNFFVILFPVFIIFYLLLLYLLLMILFNVTHQFKRLYISH